MPGAYDEPEYEIHDTLRSAGTVPPSTIVPIVDARHIEKTAGSAVKVKSALAAKTFLNVMFAEAPPLIAIGPCGFGLSALPWSAHRNSPPSADETVSVSCASPSFDGSKVTSTATSAPSDPSAAGACTEASTSKSPDAPLPSASLYVSALRR